MMGFRKIFEHLGSGFSQRWAWLTAAGLMIILDPVTIIGLIWFFVFSGRYPLEPSVLTWLASLYLLLAVVLVVISFIYGRLESIQTTGLFYMSVGIFFLLRGVMGTSGTDFSNWPWIIVWMAILVLIFSHFGKELEKPDVQ